MAAEPRCFRRCANGTAIPKDQFWSYVLCICHIGDLSLLEKLLSQYHDQPVRLHDKTDRTNRYTSVYPARARIFPILAEEQQDVYFNNQCSADDEGEDNVACQSLRRASSMPQHLQRTTTLRKRHSHRDLGGYLTSAPSLPDAMLLAAVLGSQVAIVDYLITEFRPFLSLNDGLISATLESTSSLKMFKVLHSHYPGIVNYCFSITLQSSSETDLWHESLTPFFKTPNISVLQEAMSRSQINPNLYNVILFLVESGALLKSENQSTSQHYDIIQWAIWTTQPLSIIRACLEQGRPKVNMVSIYSAMQHGDYELLNLLLACGRPTKEEVSTGELIRLARLPAAAFATDNEEAISRCCTMMREYLLARVIRSRASPAGDRGAGVRRRRSCSIRSTSSTGTKPGSRCHTEACRFPENCNDSNRQHGGINGKDSQADREVCSAGLLTRLHSLDSDISKRSWRRNIPSLKEEIRSRSLDSSRNEVESTTENMYLKEINIRTIESPIVIDSPSPWTTITDSPRSRRHITFSSSEAPDVLDIIEEGSLIHVKRKNSAAKTSEDKARRRHSKESRRRDSSIIKGAREKVKKSLSGFF